MTILIVAVAVAIIFLSQQPAPAPMVQERVVERLAEERVVVLPGPDGRAGSVVVQREGARQTLDQPFASSVIRGAGAPEAQRLSEAEVKEQFGVLLAALPARPASYLLYFVTGRDELTAESEKELQELLQALKARPVPDVAVIGHTDTVGVVEANDQLSLQRAERVKGLLVTAGIPAEQVQTAGRGERELLVPTGDNVAEPRNRRVEINVR